MSIQRVACLLATLAPLAACGDDKKAKSSDESSDKPSESAPRGDVGEVSDLPVLGVKSPTVFTYRWGSGSKAYARAKAALEKEARDWEVVAKACREALAKDANHLAARRLLGVAMARTGNHEKATEHLSAALSADWLRWGPGLGEDKALTEFFEAKEGKALLALNERYAKSFYAQAEAGILLVAKRSSFKRPKKDGKQWAASRGELFSYSLEHERYLRLTHTGESLIGYIHSPSRDRIAYLRATHYNIAPSGEVSFADARVGVLDARTFARIGKEARFKKPAEQLMLFYDSGEELHLQPDGGSPIYSVDFEAGKLSRSSTRPFADFTTLSEIGQFNRETPLLYATFEMARVLKPWRGVIKSRELLITSFTVERSEKQIALPASGGKKIRRISMSPDGKHVALVGIGDACMGEVASALYVADTETGKLKHVHRGNGLHTVRWLDDSRFVFEAEKGELRIYDVATRTTTAKLKNRHGLALDALSNLLPAEHCPRAAEPLVEGLEDDEGYDDIEDGEVEEGEHLDH